jgi:hypothetical protein
LSPSTLSPSTLSPSTLSPSTLSPSTLLPSTISPTSTEDVLFSNEQISFSSDRKIIYVKGKIEIPTFFTLFNDSELYILANQSDLETNKTFILAEKGKTLKGRLFFISENFSSEINRNSFGLIECLDQLCDGIFSQISFQTISKNEKICQVFKIEENYSSNLLSIILEIQFCEKRKLWLIAVIIPLFFILLFSILLIIYFIRKRQDNLDQKRFQIFKASTNWK